MKALIGVTRTIGPLHFEDLEPRRFEDLTRQLIYDFRRWRALEATGRSGSDEGFDARGFEIVATDDNLPSDDDGSNDDANPAPVIDEDRLWLIQCKREQSITPAKIKKYLAEMPASSTDSLYGMIFVAACDFSKKTRDAFREWCRTAGIREAYIWGKADIEDQLLQPKNDGLLFAYFGISLQIRKRTLKTALRSRLTTKRACERILSPNSLVLLRDPEETRYPFVSDEEQKEKPILVRVRQYLGTDAFGGVRLQAGRFFAYLADDGEGWDYFSSYDDDRSQSTYENPWADPEKAMSYEDRGRLLQFWDKLSDNNKSWFVRAIVIKYDDILAIDEKGDDVARMPHLYTTVGVPCAGVTYIESVRAYDTRILYNLDPTKRLNIFPSTIDGLPPRAGPKFEE